MTKKHDDKVIEVKSKSRLIDNILRVTEVDGKSIIVSYPVYIGKGIDIQGISEPVNIRFVKEGRYYYIIFENIKSGLVGQLKVPTSYVLPLMEIREFLDKEEMASEFINLSASKVGRRPVGWPTSSDIVTVSATILEGDEELQSIFLRYSVNSGEKVYIPMSSAGIVYSADIPAQVVDAEVIYDIAVYNMVGNILSLGSGYYKIWDKPYEYGDLGYDLNYRNP